MPDSVVFRGVAAGNTVRNSSRAPGNSSIKAENCGVPARPSDQRGRQSSSAQSNLQPPTARQAVPAGSRSEWGTRCAGLWTRQSVDDGRYPSADLQKKQELRRGGRTQVGSRGSGPPRQLFANQEPPSTAKRMKELLTSHQAPTARVILIISILSLKALALFFCLFLLLDAGGLEFLRLLMQLGEREGLANLDRFIEDRCGLGKEPVFVNNGRVLWALSDLDDDFRKSDFRGPRLPMGLLSVLRNHTNTIKDELRAYNQQQKSLPLVSEIAPSQATVSHSGNEWRMLFLRLYGQETATARNVFARTMALLADGDEGSSSWWKSKHAIANVWLSSVKPGGTIRTHRGHSSMVLRYLLAVDLGLENHVLDDEVEEGDDYYRTQAKNKSKATPSNDFSVWNSRWERPVVQRSTTENSTIAPREAYFQKNWTAEGDDILFDDTFYHESSAPKQFEKRTMLLLDIVRKDCSPSVNFLIEVVLCSGLLRFFHPEVAEMHRRLQAREL